MRRICLAIIFAISPMIAWAASPSPGATPEQPADPARQALAATVQDLTQAWVSTRAQLAAAEAQIQTLQTENKACKPDTATPAPAK